MSLAPRPPIGAPVANPLTTAKGKSLLLPTLWSLATRAWKVRWLPVLLFIGSLATFGAAFVSYDRRTTHFVPPGAAADAVDHPFKYTQAATEQAQAAYTAGVRSVLLLVACGLLGFLAYLAVKDR